MRILKSIKKTLKLTRLGGNLQELEFTDIRIIANVGFLESCCPLFIELKILPLTRPYNIFSFKTLTGLLANSKTMKF